MSRWRRASTPSTPPPPRGQQVRTDAPEGPGARVLTLDIGLYGHRGGISSMFWYPQGGKLHAHMSELLPEDATLVDQLDILEAWAETYKEYWRVSPVVAIGVTVLSPIGRRDVRAHLNSWFNPPHRRRLISVGDYAGEQRDTPHLTSRKKLRDLVAERLAARAITLTQGQHDAVALYTGRRERPGRDDDDEWRTDENDALALPVAYACLAARYLLPTAQLTPADRLRHLERAKRAWQMHSGLPEGEAWDRAVRQGHPRQQQQSTTAGPVRFHGPASPLRETP
jgi:hypothetical protein